MTEQADQGQEVDRLGEGNARAGSEGDRRLGSDRLPFLILERGRYIDQCVTMIAGGS